MKRKNRLLIFDSEDQFLRALKQIKERHPHDVEALSPIDLKHEPDFAGKNQALNIVKMATLAGAMGGATLGALLVWYASAVDAPLNIGGRPLNSWPVAIPIVWVLAVLLGGLSGFAMFFWRLNLPLPYDPVFDFPGFQLQKDLFYLFVSPLVDSDTLSNLGALRIEEAK